MNRPRNASDAVPEGARRSDPDDAKRRRPRKTTPAYLDRAALAYLERFASSAENLRRVLTRKLKRRCRLREEDPAPFLPLIEQTVEKALRGGLLDDRRYAESRVATLRRRGGSSRLIAARLAAKGVAPDAVAAALSSNDGELAEVEAAWAFARRRRLGPHREKDRAGHREKDLAAMARAGFRFDLARQVVDAAEPSAVCADPPRW